MGLRKCPRCELNYIRDDEKLCDVCSRKRRSDDDDDNDELLCIECGVHRAMKGRDICAYCYKENMRQEQLANQRKSSAALALNDVAIDDVEVPIDDDDKIPEDEMEGIEHEFDEDEDEGFFDDDDGPDDDDGYETEDLDDDDDDEDEE